MATDTETQAISLGEAFAQALSRKDFDGVTRLLHPEVDFRGLTPGRMWEASDADTVVESVLKIWFEASDELERLVSTQTDKFADRARVGYRLEGLNPDGPFVVEQQAYYGECDGRIGWMRVLCSGFRPRPE
jgi:hypothetical protein